MSNLPIKGVHVPDVLIYFNRPSVQAGNSHFRTGSTACARSGLPAPFLRLSLRNASGCPTCAYRYRSQRLETHHLGASNFPQRWTVYNKDLEAKASRVLWRTEAQVRFSPDESFCRSGSIQHFVIQDLFVGARPCRSKIQEKAKCESTRSTDLNRKSCAKYRSCQSFNRDYTSF